jgi:hypothetical protein
MPGVPSGSPTEVEHSGPARQHALLHRPVDESGRFAVAGVRAERVIVGESSHDANQPDSFDRSHGVAACFI